MSDTFAFRRVPIPLRHRVRPRTVKVVVAVLAVSFALSWFGRWVAASERASLQAVPRPESSNLAGTMRGADHRSVYPGDRRTIPSPRPRCARPSRPHGRSAHGAHPSSRPGRRSWPVDPGRDLRRRPLVGPAGRERGGDRQHVGRGGHVVGGSLLLHPPGRPRPDRLRVLDRGLHRHRRPPRRRRGLVGLPASVRTSSGTRLDSRATTTPSTHLLDKEGCIRDACIRVRQRGAAGGRRRAAHAPRVLPAGDPRADRNQRRVRHVELRRRARCSSTASP